MKINFEIALIVIHILLGVVISIFEPISKIYSYGIILFFMYGIIFKKNKHQYILFGLAYVAGSDVFLRMTHGVVFHELHKYLIIVFSVIGIFLKGGLTKGYVYLLYVIFLIPAIFIADYYLEDQVRKLIAFNLAGPFSLAVVSYYLYERKIKFKTLNRALFYFTLPVITMATYMYFFVDVGLISFIGTASNFDTSGGFGPNQVSTVLGVAVFIMLSRLILTFKFLNLITIINLSLFIFLTYRNILTFSRGGVIAALFASILFIFYVFRYANTKFKFKIIKLFLASSVLLFSIWTYVSVQTSGMIDNRYANKNAAGVIKDDVSAGRGMLAEYELQAFQENPIFGIGVGKIISYRLNRSGVYAASHNEITRLLAEHGAFGIMALLILLITPFLVRMQTRSNIYFYSFFLIWFLTINHSATRIAAPAFIYALSLIDIQYEKNTIRRKSIKR